MPKVMITAENNPAPMTGRMARRSMTAAINPETNRLSVTPMKMGIPKVVVKKKERYALRSAISPWAKLIMEVDLLIRTIPRAINE